MTVGILAPQVFVAGMIGGYGGVSGKGADGCAGIAFLHGAQAADQLDQDLGGHVLCMLRLPGALECELVPHDLADARLGVVHDQGFEQGLGLPRIVRFRVLPQQSIGRVRFRYVWLYHFTVAGESTRDSWPDRRFRGRVEAPFSGGCDAWRAGLHTRFRDGVRCLICFGCGDAPKSCDAWGTFFSSHASQCDPAAVTLGRGWRTHYYVLA
ncbi:hypothetical protein SBA4_590009 [Candidatus Sulfopaludibacter sp. SbA4]|nr:hypothetical protein SBA4_590009 [Candidatus Sulfopaludibacter sp. SbA4]